MSLISRQENTRKLKGKRKMILKVDWNDKECREKYKALMNRNPKTLNEKEKEFVVDMYHLEEFACGMDGD